jgi:hypothetical protein
MMVVFLNACLDESLFSTKVFCFPSQKTELCECVIKYDGGCLAVSKWIARI